MKKHKKIFIVIIFLIMLISNYQVFASSSLDGEIEFSQEYLEYLELENKENIIAPSTYDIPKNNIKITNPFKLARSVQSLIQSAYSLKDIIPDNMVIKSQGSTNTCWAFASLASLESYLALKDYKNGITTPIIYDFSERHMDYATSRIFLNDAVNEFGFNRTAGDTAVTGIPMAYLTNGLGAISEDEMKFEPYCDLIDISEIQNKEVVTQVKDIVTFPTYSVTEDTTQIKEQIKEHIMNYGAISAQIHSASFYEGSRVYNAETSAAYCDSSSYNVDHSVAIVGWDDNYPVENFVEENRPTNPGAWIIKNSWGEDSGDNGYIYVSYEDVNIYKKMIGIENAQTEIDYENIYQYDEFGGFLKYKVNNTSKIYLATEFDKKTNGKEYLTQVSIHAPETYTCKVFVNPNGTSKEMKDLQQVELETGETQTFDAGYHTIEFLKPIKINSDSFVVVLEIEGTQEDYVSMMIEMNYGEFYTDSKNANDANHDYDYVTIADEKCFLATEEELNNNTWRTTSKTYELSEGKLPNYDTTIKAFTTSDIFEGISIITPPTKLLYVEGQDFDPTGMVVNGNYANGNVIDIADYTIQDGKDLTLEQTSITVEYNGFTTTQPIEVVKNTVENIEVKTAPTKTEYTEGDDFDPTGMEIEATYKDGTKKIITDYVLKDYQNLSKGQTTITVEYEGKATTQNIVVNERKVEIEEPIIATQITIKSMPTKVEYIQSKEELDLTGGVIEVLYSNDTTEEIPMDSENISVIGFDNTKVGEQTITLIYENKTIQFKVQIKELPKPVNSNLDNIQGNVIRIRTYSYTNKNQKDYAVIDIELVNIAKITENEKMEYYYYLSVNPNEESIVDWTEITGNQSSITENKISFEINTLNLQNYEDFASANEIYLYVKEVAIRNGMKSEKIASPLLLDAENVTIEEYLDGEIKTNVDVTPKEEEEEEDNTKAPGLIPKAGNDLGMLCLAVIIIIIGKIAYSRYKDIEIK